MRGRALVLALLAAGCPKSAPSLPPVSPPCPAGRAPVSVVAFHGDRARLGWNPAEIDLTPSVVRDPAFGWLWDSEPLDDAEVDGLAYPPRLYASPLYADDVTLSTGAFAGLTADVVLAASSNGWVYALNACDRTRAGVEVRAGTILWRAQLAPPRVVPKLDGGVPLGVLSTPFLDLAASPPRLYVVTMSETGFLAFALDLSSGAVLPGWPAAINGAIVALVNSNGPSLFREPQAMSQRAALNLGPDGATLYVGFGTHGDYAPGWMVAVDTRSARVTAAFAAAPSTAGDANGGIWAPGGPAVDGAGRVYATTGNSVSGPLAGVWGETLLRWDPPLALAGTYTPFNHCALDAADVDLGGGGPLLLPELSPSESATPRLVAFGSKQGNVYLLARDALPGRLDARPPCSTDSTSDGSLLPPGAQPQFGARGPLNVFGPYSELYGNIDRAKMRSSLAYFRDAGGARFLFASGASKAAVDSEQSVPPSLAKLRVVTAPGAPAYLAVEKYETTLAFVNPGAPVVTSNGAADAIVWVLDQNARRTQSLLDPSQPKPILYAVDATTMTPLWRSGKELLHAGSKYSVPAVAHGFVFVATDRIQAFGIRP